MNASGEESLESFWGRTGSAWQEVLSKLQASRQGEDEEDEEGSRNVVVVGTEAICSSMLCHCLQIGPEKLSLFHLSSSSLSVIDFPDGAEGQGVVRCLNYTAHLGRWAVPVTVPGLTDEEDF